MKNISRQIYLDRIGKFLDKGLIIVLTGQRRVGKSHILKQIGNQIIENNPRANIISIDKELKAYDAIVDDDSLATYVEDRLKESQENYLLIDEVQEILNFELTLRSLNAQEKCQIIITGSNASVFSSELSTLLGGRYIEFHIQSLSYSEFLLFHSLTDSLESIEKYLNYGGLPHLYRLGLDNDDVVEEYLKNVYNTIILKDVIQRGKIRNIPLFENLMLFVADNIGKVISASSLSKYFKSQNVDMPPLTAINYFRAACSAFVVNSVPRYDIRGKKILESANKYYFEDLGLRNALVGTNRVADIEKLVENAVFLRLKGLGYKVYVGDLYNGEIDFVAIKGGQKIYVQAAYLLSNDQTIEREFGNLLSIKDNYPKYVVSMDESSAVRGYEGVFQMSLRKFLLTDFD